MTSDIMDLEPGAVTRNAEDGIVTNTGPEVETGPRLPQIAMNNWINLEALFNKIIEEMQVPRHYEKPYIDGVLDTINAVKAEFEIIDMELERV
jgi:hypothetical protein